MKIRNFIPLLLSIYAINVDGVTRETFCSETQGAAIQLSMSNASDESWEVFDEYYDLAT